MNDRPHVRRDGQEDNGRSPVPRPQRRENPETASILELQGSAGNRAVAQLLELQRQPADQAPVAEPADNSKASATGTMTIPEMDVTMPILSFSQQIGQPRKPESTAGEVVVSIALENLDARISEAVAKGRQFKTITVTIDPKSTFTLRGVVFSSFQVGSDTATLSLNFTSMEFSPGG